MEKQTGLTKKSKEIPEYNIFSLSYVKRDLLLDTFQERKRSSEIPYTPVIQLSSTFQSCKTWNDPEYTERQDAGVRETARFPEVPRWISTMNRSSLGEQEWEKMVYVCPGLGQGSFANDTWPMHVSLNRMDIRVLVYWYKGLVSLWVCSNWNSDQVRLMPQKNILQAYKLATFKIFENTIILNFQISGKHSVQLKNFPFPRI